MGARLTRRAVQYEREAVPEAGCEIDDNVCQNGSSRKLPDGVHFGRRNEW